MVLTFKVKVKEVKVQNIIISILGKDKTCLKIWTTLEQNCGYWSKIVVLTLKVKVKVKVVKVQNLMISILG